MIDTKLIKKDFPIFSKVKDICYLDNASTTFKPKSVINNMNKYYYSYCANTHRGDYNIAYLASKKFEETRKSVAKFIHAKEEEISFTSGTTFSLNQIAQILKYQLKKDDEIILSLNEHASNVLPWYNIAKEKEAKIVFVPLDEKGNITVENFLKVINNKTKIVSFASVTNVLGNIVPVKDLVKITHKYNAYYVSDSAQEAPHRKIDVKDSDVDFIAFSSHKILGPTGVGIMYVKKELTNILHPFIYGGDMNARFNSNLEVSYKEYPTLLEAGTQNVAGVIGLNYALKYINKIGLDNILNHEKKLKEYAVKKLSENKKITIYNAHNDVGIVTFNVKDVFSQDVATYLSSKNICIRSGTHCAKLLPEFLNVNATCRASFYFYNDFDDIDRLVSAVNKSEDFLDAFFN